MNIRLTYRNQQPFYEGFTFFPITGIRRYNHFAFKVYNNGHNLNDVFNTERNKEVLDTNYIIAIRRKIMTYSVPQTRVVATHLQTTRESLLELLNIPYDDKRALARALGALRLLERGMHAYKEAQSKLRSDLKLLLSSRQFINPCKTTSEDIEVLTNKWQHMSDEIERGVCILIEFNWVTVPPAEQASVLTARIQVDCLLSEVRKILQVKGMIIHLLYGWMGLREQHEQSEVLN